MKKLLLSLCPLLFLATACKKSNSAQAYSKDNISGTYKLVAMDVTVPGLIGAQDAYAGLATCEQDNEYCLNPDDTFLYVDAGNVCEPAGDYKGQWSVKGSQISFFGNTGEIVSFDGLILQVRSRMIDQDNAYTVTSTYRRQQ